MMLYNFKVAVRNALKNRALSVVKLLGLCISFAVTLFTAGYVYYETSFDKNIPDHDKIYRCYREGKLNNEDADYAIVSPALAAALKSSIPEIKETVRILPRGRQNVTYENEDFDGGNLIYTDNNFFKFFGFSVMTNQENPLTSQNDLVITRGVAEKQFGSVEEALGKTVKIRDEDCIISGVCEDLPKNFHLQVTLFQSVKKSRADEAGWNVQNYFTYFKTANSDIDPDALNFKISKSVYTYYYDEIDGAAAQCWDDLKYSDNKYLFTKAELLTNIHFSNHKYDMATTADKIYVYGAALFTILMLIISTVNFTNLTVASCSTRIKESGIRQINGANKWHITWLLLNDTILFLSVSFAVAVAAYLLTGKQLADFIGSGMPLTKGFTLSIIIAVFIGLSIFYLSINGVAVSLFSKKNLLNLLKSSGNPEKNHFSGNNGFILIQFILSGLIILSSLIVHKQVDFLLTKNPGYNKENILQVNLTKMSPLSRKSFVDKLKSYDAVKSVSMSNVSFGGSMGMNSAYFETQEEKNYFHTSILPVDEEFLNTFDLKLKKGRFFEKERQSDINAVVLNESAAKDFSGNDSSIGKSLITGGQKYQIIGIVKDFNFRSLHYSIEPLVITCTENARFLFVKYKNAQVADVLNILQSLWGEFKPQFPFSYSFHDEILANHYARDEQAGKLLSLLSLISVIIACIGLYAVSAFIIIRKTKEIGIRKVSGAKISEILTLLNKDFVKWVVIAFVIATPVAYYAMNKWLENFAYKTTLSWWIFALAGFLALGIALLTVSWQSWRAATRNPLEALRYE